MSANVQQTAQVRKVFAAGRSLAVVLPPAALDHLHVGRSDYIYFDISAKGFLILSVAPVPPQFSHPELFPEGAIDIPPPNPEQAPLPFTDQADTP